MELNLELLEKNAIQEAMCRFNGNKSAAARALGICLKTLYVKLNKYKGALK